MCGCMCHDVVISYLISVVVFIFFFNDTATTEIYPLSLHDALPIYILAGEPVPGQQRFVQLAGGTAGDALDPHRVEERSEEHTSELQSRQYLVCRLLLEKKKK